MVRIFFAACLSLLLVGLQQETLVHALQHDHARLADARDTAFHAPAEGPCVVCSLLAGGTPAAATANAMPVPGSSAIAFVASFERSIPAAPPAYYASRAPPVLL